jgi:hypothetical protein
MDVSGKSNQSTSRVQRHRANAGLIRVEVEVPTAEDAHTVRRFAQARRRAAASTTVHEGMVEPTAKAGEGLDRGGGRPIRAKTYASVLHAMLRGALARIGTGSGHGGGGFGRQAGAAAGRLEVAAARDDVRMGKRGDTGEVLIADLVAGVA